MQDKPIRQILTEKCDPRLVANLLFFNRWSEPQGFFEWSALQRRNAMRKFAPDSVEPSATNYWIWFGSYANSSPNASPVARYCNESVARMLYCQFVAPIKGGNLMAEFTTCRSDVNPHKFFPKTNLTRSQLMEQYKALTGADPIEAMGDKMRERFNGEVNKCLKLMDEYFTPGVFDTRRDMTKMMEENFPSIVVNEALRITRLKFID